MFGRVTRKPLRRTSGSSHYTRLFFEHCNITIYADRPVTVYQFDSESRAWEFAQENGYNVYPQDLCRVVVKEDLPG